MDDNNIIINQQVSLPYPFGVHKAFPLDSRSFFSSMEEAQSAVHDAVQLQRNQNGDFILPSEENGGVDSVYYYGEPIAVAENNADTVGLYIITKAFDEHNEPYGELQNVCSGLGSEYLRRDEANDLINSLIQEYIENNLNTDCIDDYLFTNAIDDCGNILPSDGLYAYGLKEVNGVLQKCEDAKKVLSFDPQTQYNKNTNPLATMDSVRAQMQNLDYTQLTHKPAIDGVTLYENTTLDDIGAVSHSSFDSHVLNVTIHTPITFSPDKISRPSPVKSIFVVDGNKLGITFGSQTFYYRLMPWKDIPDFFVVYGNIFSNISNDWFLDTGEAKIPYQNVTVNDILNLAANMEERNGYYTDYEFPLVTNTQGEIFCDYVHELTRDKNAMFILSRTSTAPLPVLDMVMATNTLDDYFIYDRENNSFKQELSKTNLLIEDDTYSLQVFVGAGNASLSNNTFGIKFTN